MDRPRAPDDTGHVPAQLSDSDEIIRAISAGQVDAFVISETDEPRVITLAGADLPYRLLTDRMLQGAVTVGADSTILYANKPFARLVGVEAERLAGKALKQMVHQGDVPLLEAILARALNEPIDAELVFRRGDGNFPARVEADKPLDAADAICLVVTDLSEQRQHEAIAAAESLGRSILDQSVDAIVVCDMRGYVIRASDSSHLLCDCNPLLHAFEEVFPLSAAGSALDLEAIRRGHVLRNASFEMKAAGRTMSLLVSAGPVVDVAGKTVATVITLTDVTELKRIEAELKEADARKDEMLAVVVHELRSPLANIGMAVELLHIGADPFADKRLHLRESLSRSVAHIARLVDDLSDFNRIRLNKLSLDVAVLDARSVVTRAVEDCRALAESRSQRIEAALGDAPMLIQGDETRLAQVFINLLYNATKFTQAGGEIRVTVAREATQVVIVVSDNGIGIGEEMIERIFQPFEQLNERKGGLGVGLALARRIVELHGGTIFAASDGPGMGSAFTVRLPLVS